jgi:hypothetical protein
MKRRDFIAFLPGAAAVPSIFWPRSASAEQTRMPMVGLLSSGSHQSYRHEARTLRRLTLLVGAKSVVDKVLILRHEAFHRSAHISYNDVFTMAAVKPDELRDLTDKALNIANRLLLARGLEDQYFTELPREAAEAMMKALRVKGP